MRIVTKYAMLALFAASFIALNNCGNQSVSSSKERSLHDENVSASDFAVPGPPVYAEAVPVAEAVVVEPVVVEPIIAPVLIEPVLVDFDVDIAEVFEINCDDGTDNDGDGSPDCMDIDCHVHPECSEWGPPLEELVNGRALTVYPNGIIVPEDIVLLNARGVDDDDAHGWQRDNFFATHQSDCWIDPKYDDPYYNVELGEALVAGPFGPIGPQLFPAFAVAYYGPREGLINECEFGTDLMFHHMDDDNGAGAGAGGDTADEEGGTQDTGGGSVED